MRLRSALQLGLLLLTLVYLVGLAMLGLAAGPDPRLGGIP